MELGFSPIKKENLTSKPCPNGLNLEPKAHVLFWLQKKQTNGPFEKNKERKSMGLMSKSKQLNQTNQ